MSRLDQFNDNEIYLLKRMAIESSWTIVMSGKYSKEEIKLHNKLLNEFTEEDGRRLYKK